jgi:hypothetical protein
MKTLKQGASGNHRRKTKEDEGYLHIREERAVNKIVCVIIRGRFLVPLENLIFRRSSPTQRRRTSGRSVPVEDHRNEETA